MDGLTRYARLYPVPNAKAFMAVSCLQSFMMEYRKPHRLITDKGRTYIGKETKRYLEEAEVHHTLNSARQPQVNGIVERVNRKIIPMIIPETTEKQWDVKLPKNHWKKFESLKICTTLCPIDEKSLEIIGKDPTWIP